MDFELTPEQHSLTDAAATFANEVVGELPGEATRFATEAAALIGARGLFGTASILSAALVASELAHVSSALGSAYASGWLFVDALRRHGGSNGDLTSVAERAASGLLVGVVVASSARGGLDVGIEGPDGTRPLSGKTGPAAILPTASHAIVAARTDGGGAMLSCIDLASPGVTRSPAPSLGFARLPCGSLEFHGFHVSPHGLLAAGPAAKGMNASLGHARCILSSAVAVGIARFAFEHALAYVRKAGKPTQSTEFIVSDLATGLDAAWLATLNAAWHWDTRADGAVEAHGAQLFATRTASEICHGALKACGAAGYDDALRGAYLDARHLELYAGTDAADIDAMASNLLGEG